MLSPKQHFEDFIVILGDLFPIQINKKYVKEMNNYELTGYALPSTQNPNYLFFLKVQQLIANSQTYFEESTACLLVQSMPKLSSKTYYYLRYNFRDKKKGIIKILEAVPLCCIGQEWMSPVFLKHLAMYQGSLKEPIPDNQFMKEVMETGELRVNDQGWIYVKSVHTGFRKKLKLVNQPYAVPLLKGCKVDFFLRKYAQNEGPKVKISRLSFRPVTLAGILKMIKGRIFFEPRHTDYERMIPLTIPEQLMEVIYECLPDYRGTLPYNIFKRYDGDHDRLNKKLAQYVLQGRFVDWPLRFSHPVINIEAIDTMNCMNLKQATLYELGIPILDYDAEENRISNEIIDHYDPKSYGDRWQVQERCYTFDCEGGSCFDDAFSFKEINQGFQIVIHISDVAALISKEPYLLEKAQARDQTIYIKNYYKSMFPQHLRDLMSLSADKPRLTYSLLFQINTNGIINYDSVEMKQSLIKVTQNITHGDPIKNLEDRQLFCKVIKVLKTCKEVSKLVLFDESQSAVVTSQLLYLSAYLPMLIFAKNLSQLPQNLKAGSEALVFPCQKAERILQESKVVADKETYNEVKLISQKKSYSREFSETQIASNILSTFENNSDAEPIPSLLNTETTFSCRSDYSENSEIQEGNSIEKEEYMQPNKKSQNPFRTLGIQKNDFFRKVSSREGSAAECYRFLDKLFRAAGLIINFSEAKNMQNAFKECQRKYNNKISQLYFRTKFIMSKQHFQSIARLNKEGHLKPFESSNYMSKPQKGKDQYPSLYKVHSDLSKSQTKQKENIYSEQEPTSVKIQEQSKYKKNQSDLSDQKQQVVKETFGQEENLSPPLELNSSQKQNKQHDLSQVLSIMSFAVESGLQTFCSSSRQTLIETINQLELLAKEMKIAIVHRTFAQKENLFNSLVKKVPHDNQSIDNLNFFKWNTPIRSGASLQALILLKQYNWMFQGRLLPSTAMRCQQQIPCIDEKIKKIIKENSRQETLTLNGRMKEACRQLQKIDFLFVLRQQPNRVWDFLTITSPSQRVQFVYHQAIQEIEVDNPQSEVTYYTKVQGRFKGIFEFPLKLKAVLLERGEQTMFTS